MMNVWVFLAVLIILVLAAVAAYYQRRLYLLRREMRAQEQRSREAEAKHREGVNDSIQIICRATVAGQVGYVEASIRLSALMDQLGLDQQERQDYAVFDKMTETVKHIPMLAAWKKLPKHEKAKYELEMQRHEAELGDFVRAAAEDMLGKRW